MVWRSLEWHAQNCNFLTPKHVCAQRTVQHAIDAYRIYIIIVIIIIQLDKDYWFGWFDVWCMCHITRQMANIVVFCCCCSIPLWCFVILPPRKKWQFIHGILSINIIMIIIIMYRDIFNVYHFHRFVYNKRGRERHTHTHTKMQLTLQWHWMYAVRRAPSYPADMMAIRYCAALIGFPNGPKMNEHQTHCIGSYICIFDAFHSIRAYLNGENVFVMMVLCLFMSASESTGRTFCDEQPWFPWIFISNNNNKWWQNTD